MNYPIFAAFTREMVKQAAMPPVDPAQTNTGLSQGADQEKKPGLLRRLALPVAAAGLGAYGIRRAIPRIPFYAKHIRRSAGEIGGIGKELGEAVASPVQSLKKGWRELGAAPGTEKRTNELKDVLRDALGGRKYSLDVVDAPTKLRESGIASIGTRYQGRVAQSDVESALKGVLHRRSGGELVLDRTATPEAIENAYKALQKVQIRKAEGLGEQIGDRFYGGMSALTRNLPGERAILPASGALSAYGELSQKEDPVTGRERGLGERLGRAGATTFTNLAFNPIFAKQPGVLAGLATQIAADTVASRAGGLAGRGVDVGVKKLRGSNQPAPPPAL
jgi:hypothetical protein